MRFLYKEAQGEVDWEGGNTGLWYDKFFDRWQENATIKDGDKLSWIKKTAEKPRGCEKLLKQAKARLVRMVESAGGQVLHYRLESDFVTGLGRQHPVENGFAWHHTLGVPYLPGSSVKGVVRAWAEQWDETEKSQLKHVFGSECKKDKDFRAGSVVFLDALPTAPVRLKADIMTPHYAPYYRGEAPPADWHSPNPIPFLVVEAGTSFVFGILPRRSEHQEDCQTAKRWIEAALEWIGAGAKTAVGYGRFAEDAEARRSFEKARIQERARKQRREEEERRRREIEEQTRDKSELYGELYKASIEGNWRQDKDAFSQQGVIDGWMERLESSPERDAIELFDELMRQHYGDVLKNPDATKGKKGKPKHKPRQRELAKRWLRIREEHRGA